MDPSSPLSVNARVRRRGGTYQSLPDASARKPKSRGISAGKTAPQSSTTASGHGWASWPVIGVLLLLLLLALAGVGGAAYYVWFEQDGGDTTTNDREDFEDCNDALRLILQELSPSHSPTPTPVHTQATLSSSRTPSSTHTLSASESVTPSTTSTASETSTKSASSTPTPSNTPTQTGTGTQTPTQTGTPTGTPTQTPSKTDTSSKSPTPSNTPTNTPSTTASSTKTPTTTSTHTQSGSTTSTATESVTRTSSRTPSKTPTTTVSLTASQSNTGTPSITPTVSDTSTASASNTPSISASLTVSASSTESLSATSTVSVSPTATSTVSKSSSRTPTRTASPSVSSSLSSSQTPSQTPSISQSSTPTPTPAPTTGFHCSIYGPTPSLTTVEFPYEGYVAHIAGSGGSLQTGFRNSWCPGVSVLPDDEIQLVVTDNCASFPQSQQFDGDLFSTCDVQKCGSNCGSFCTDGACYENSMCTLIPAGTLHTTVAATSTVINLRTLESSASDEYTLLAAQGVPCTSSRRRRSQQQQQKIRGYEDADYPAEWYLRAQQIKATPGFGVFLAGTNTTTVHQGQVVRVGWSGFDLYARLSIVIMQPGMSRYRVDVNTSERSVAIYLGPSFVRDTRFNYVLASPLDNEKIVAVSPEFSII